MTKIRKTKSFETNLRGKSLIEVKRYNRAMRKDIANNIVDIYNNADVALWYSSERIRALQHGITMNNDKTISSQLSDIYKYDVKPAANKMITEYALKVFAVTAISQNEKLDSLYVIVSQLNLIKRLVALYGYRPSDDKLLKIYKTVLVNALLSYGAQSLSTSLATGIGKKIADSASSIAFLGGAIETVLGSTFDGVANLTFAVKVGIETRRYLIKEYHLQDILDNIEDEETLNEEETQLIEESKKESSKIKKNKKGK